MENGFLFNKIYKDHDICLKLELKLWFWIINRFNLLFCMKKRQLIQILLRNYIILLIMSKPTNLFKDTYEGQSMNRQDSGFIPPKFCFGIQISSGLNFYDFLQNAALISETASMQANNLHWSSLAKSLRLFFDRNLMRKDKGGKVSLKESW